MRRTSSVPPTLLGVLVLVVSPGCFKATDDTALDDGASETVETGDTTSESSTETDTDECPEGTQDCPCGPSESCEAGLACVDGTCVQPVCGNGVIEGNEPCDDGNAVDDDECSNTCALPYCGDGIVQPNEACDDANQIDDDACSNACVAAVCGDGVVQQGEVCDDGNDIDLDDCSNTCTLPSCGDATVAGLEECDDGNQIDNDACTNACKLPACGDGILQGPEQCDDGNVVDGDTCTASCMTPTCQGAQLNPGNGILGCWYTAPAPGMSCAQVCANHGGFDAVASQHVGNAIGVFFWPAKADRGDWEAIECSSTDNNTNWGANGQVPDPNWSFGACHVNCACFQ